MSQHDKDAPLVISAPRTLARRAVRGLSNTLIIVLGFGWVVWLLSVIFYDEMGAVGSYMFAAGVVGSSIALAGAAFWLINALRRAWTHARLRRALDARLTAAGLDRDATSAEAQALRAAFWSDAQRDASRALAARLAASDEPVDMLQSIGATLSSARVPLGVLAALWALLTLMFGVGIALSSGTPLNASLSCLMISVGIVVACALFFLPIIGALRGAGRLIERQELARDRRHVVALTELASAAGGLTLANDGDEALRGALSGDVASGGELSEVAR